MNERKISADILLLISSLQILRPRKLCIFFIVSLDSESKLLANGFSGAGYIFTFINARAKGEGGGENKRRGVKRKEGVNSMFSFGP